MPGITLGPEFEQYMTQEEKAKRMPTLPRDYIPPPLPTPEKAPMTIMVAGKGPGTPVASRGTGLGGSHPKKTKQPTPEELMAMAIALQASMKEEHEARMAQGPAVKVR